MRGFVKHLIDTLCGGVHNDGLPADKQIFAAFPTKSPGIPLFLLGLEYDRTGLVSGSQWCCHDRRISIATAIAQDLIPIPS